MPTVGSASHGKQPQAVAKPQILTVDTQYIVMDMVKPFLREGEGLKLGLKRILMEYEVFKVAASGKSGDSKGKGKP